MKFARSFKIGVIRLTERFVDSDPLSGRDERKLVKHIGEQVDRYVEHIVERRLRPGDRHVGHHPVARHRRDRDRSRGRPGGDHAICASAAKSIHRFRKVVTELDLEERLKLPGLDPRRADLTVAGAVLLDTLLRKLDADEITLCDLALREGLVLDYIHQHRTDIARVDRYPDVRRRSTIELAERCNWEADHSQQVARLALTLFDQTRRHPRPRRPRARVARVRALLHDIGKHISYERHHRHSYYLIKNGDLRGFEPEEIEVIALLTRYHRRAMPDSRTPGYRKLPARSSAGPSGSSRRFCAWPKRSTAAATASSAASRSRARRRADRLEVSAVGEASSRSGRPTGSCRRSTRPRAKRAHRGAPPPESRTRPDAVETSRAAKSAPPQRNRWRTRRTGDAAKRALSSRGACYTRN